MAVFTAASDAVAGEVAMQQAVERRGRRDPARLSMRVGLALGDATEHADDWFGRCARRRPTCLSSTTSGLHLALTARFAIATRNTLPANHYARRLLWAHVWGTQYSNEFVTKILMMKG